MTGAHRARRRTGATVVVLAAFFGGGGTAWAYWTSAATGQGQGGTGVSTPLVLTPGEVGRSLYPGGVGDVAVVASNSAATATDIASLTLDSGQGVDGFAVDAAHSGCATDTLSFTVQTNAGAGWTVPAKSGAADGTLAITLTGALSMSLDAADACQGADITVYLSAQS